MKIGFRRRFGDKNIGKMILLFLSSTAVSLVFSLAATVIANSIIAKKGKLKETLQTLFPEFSWEHTGTHISLKKIVFTIYHADGFFDLYPNAETGLRNTLEVNSPGLKKTNLVLQFKPLSEYA